MGNSTPILYLQAQTLHQPTSRVVGRKCAASFRGTTLFLLMRGHYPLMTSLAFKHAVCISFASELTVSLPRLINANRFTRHLAVVQGQQTRAKRLGWRPPGELGAGHI